MTVTQLESFRAVARRRHFARAAISIGKTQPALPVHVQRLEADLGVTWFERRGRQVVLTPAGEILLPYAEKILADVTEARLRMKGAHGGTSASWGLESSRPLQPISCRRYSRNSKAVSRK